MAKSRIKILFLLITNLLLYYIYGNGILIFIITSLFAYFVSKKLHKKEDYLLIVIALDIILLPLIFYKYLVGIMSLKLIAPLGISYYTLSLISYISDIYYKRCKPPKDFYHFALYIFWFPSLIIGPINRYADFDEQFDDIKVTKDNLTLGITRITIGLIKKLIIANKLSIYTSLLAEDLSLHGVLVLLGLFIYSIELYCDFSGGIDIVLGISKIFNIDLCENFNYPFKSESVKEFWQRWHISLGRWLKDYIYIPLGGNRVSLLKSKINIIITFIVSGLWHGIQYLFWGLINGLLVAFPFKTKNRYINMIFTFIIISFLWIFFIYPNSLTAIKMFSTIFTKFDISQFNNIFNLGLTIYDYLIIIISIILLNIYSNKKDLINNKLITCSIELKLTIFLVILIIILLLGNYGLDVKSSNFIYGNF